jgi:hypothetical protein
MARSGDKKNNLNAKTDKHIEIPIIKSGKDMPSTKHKTSQPPKPSEEASDLLLSTQSKQSGLMGYVKNLFSSCKKGKGSNQAKSLNPHPARKAKIPLALKQTVWVNQFGEVYKRKCPVRWCHRVITVFDFEVGHNIPESRGGTTTPDNLRPICRQCNIGMGNRYTIDAWSQQYDRK